MRRLLLLTLLTSTTALAGERVLIAPVQGNDVVPADLVVEVEESVRSGVLRRARALDLLVMSHATLERSIDDLRATGRDKTLGLPCKSTACDAAVGRALGTGLTVSTRLTKLDGRYLALLTLTATVDGSADVLVSTSNAESASFGALLTAVQDKSEQLVATRGVAASTAPPPTSTPSSPPAAPAVQERILRRGYLTITRERELLGGYYDCTLTTTQLQCASAGLFASGQRLLVPLDAVTSVFPDNNTGIGLATRRVSYRIALMNMVEGSSQATPRQKEAERLRLEAELAAWRFDLDTAVTAARPR